MNPHFRAFGASWLVCVFLICSGSESRGQGFSNLDFERARVVLNEPNFGWLDWSMAVPGWNHSAGGDTQHVFYYQPHVGVSQYYLLMDAFSPFYAPGTQLAGNYSLAFASGCQSAADMESPWVHAFISQRGLIPSGTRSLRLLASGPFQVTINGAFIHMYPTGPNSYGGDISAFAGTVADLAIMNTSFKVHDPTIVDNIRFSPTVVPEPGTFALAGLGAAALLIFRRRNK